MLRCVDVGIKISELEYLTIGMALDMFTEKGNDGCEYDVLATQDDMDRI